MIRPCLPSRGLYFQLTIQNKTRVYISASQPGCTCTPWGEFEILRGEILKKGELGVNYTQRGEVKIGQIVWCQLYNTSFLSFQIVINRDPRLKLTKLVPSIKILVDRH